MQIAITASELQGCAYETTVRVERISWQIKATALGENGEVLASFTDRMASASAQEAARCEEYAIACALSLAGKYFDPRVVAYAKKDALYRRAIERAQRKAARRS